MPNQNKDLPKANPNIVTGAVIAGAILLALVGAMLPGWAGMAGPEATWIPLVFYALAVVDVGIALYLRSFLRKLKRDRAAGGTIRRQ
jgi:hypothetical protein